MLVNVHVYMQKQQREGRKKKCGGDTDVLKNTDRKQKSHLLVSYVIFLSIFSVLRRRERKKKRWQQCDIQALSNLLFKA